MFTLVREEVSILDAIASQQCWPLRITASTGEDAASIFVYQTAAPPLVDDFFSCVASAPQMTELPLASGAPGIPFYRTATLLVVCRSPDHAAEFWAKIQRAVQDLANNLSLVGALSVAETVTLTPAS